MLQAEREANLLNRSADRGMLSDYFGGLTCC
jgi:hypothetical protein